MAHTRFSCDDSQMKHVFKILARAKCMKKIVFVVVIMLICMYVSSEKGVGRRTCSKADSVYRIQLFDLILIARPEDVHTPSKRVGGFPLKSVSAQSLPQPCPVGALQEVCLGVCCASMFGPSSMRFLKLWMEALEGAAN